MICLVCPSENNPNWSNQLINLFLIWFTSKAFVLNNFPHSLKTVSMSTIPSSSCDMKSTLMMNKLSEKGEITSEVQGAKGDDQDDHKKAEKEEEGDGDGEPTLKWCLSSLISMHNIVWRPNLECLDAMIMVG
ncbi:unnamed protein product [Trichobilharzia regenti]|nr:unnamed protein product [Trichobilharzia regenti]